jgi:hypothetical protein
VLKAKEIYLPLTSVAFCVWNSSSVMTPFLRKSSSVINSEYRSGAFVLSSKRLLEYMHIIGGVTR